MDTLATAILQLAETLDSAPRPCLVNAIEPPVFYNMVNPASFLWKDLLRKLRSVRGIPPFAEVSPALWLAKLRTSMVLGQEERNPAVKLLAYYEQQYESDWKCGGGRARRGSDLDRAAGKPSAVVFDTTASQRDCPVLRNPPKMLEGAYVDKFLERWMERWLIK